MLVARLQFMPVKPIAIFALATLAILPINVGGQTVVMNGQVKDCFVPGQAGGVPALDVKAFSAASNGRLIRVLRSLDTLNMIGPPPAPANWNAAYEQLKSLWGSTRALTHDSTSSMGNFSMTVPSMDSVLILTFAEVEDANAYYQYQVVGGRANISLLFDMSGGGCGIHSNVQNEGQGSIQRTASGLIFQEDICPRANIEMLDGSGLVLAPLTPAGAVWGGDTYTYSH